MTLTGIVNKVFIISATVKDMYANHPYFYRVGFQINIIIRLYSLCKITDLRNFCDFFVVTIAGCGYVSDQSIKSWLWNIIFYHAL